MKVPLEINILIVLRSLSTQSVAKAVEDSDLFAVMAGIKPLFEIPISQKNYIFWLAKYKFTPH